MFVIYDLEQVSRGELCRAVSTIETTEAIASVNFYNLHVVS